MWFDVPKFASQSQRVLNGYLGYAVQTDADVDILCSDSLSLSYSTFSIPSLKLTQL